MRQISLGSEIIPGYGLGGICIGDRLSSILSIVEREACQDKDHWMNGMFAIQYRICGSLIVQINVLDGKINWISAGQGYRGRLFGDVEVGMRIEEVRWLHPSLYWDDEDEVCFFREADGVALILENPDMRMEDDLSNKVAEIAVFAVPDSIASEGS